MIHTLGNFPNTDNWMQRFATRGCDLFLSLKNQGCDISRFEVYLARQKFNLYSNFKERSSADCKFLQSILRNEYQIDNIPANMMPVAQLEAIIGTILAENKLNKTNFLNTFYKELVRTIEENTEEVEQEEKICPICGASMQIRRSRFGKLFYGCL